MTHLRSLCNLDVAFTEFSYCFKPSLQKFKACLKQKAMKIKVINYNVSSCSANKLFKKASKKFVGATIRI